MKFSISKILFSFVLVGGLSGCLMTRDEIAETEQRKTVQQQVTTLQKNNADATSKYTEINEEIRELNGRIETLENKLQVSAKEKEKTQILTDQQLAETNKKVLALQEEVQKLENQITFLNQEMVKMSTPVPAAHPVASDKKADLFKNGEEAFTKKDWKQAIQYYQKYREVFPTGKKYVIATYKIGYSFQELGMKEESETFFKDVISKFPDSNLAKLSKERLKKK